MKFCPFPENLKKIRSFLPEILSLLQENSNWYCFLVVEDSIKKEVRCSATNSACIQKDRGIIMRILAGHCNFEYASNCLDKDHLLKEARAFKTRTATSLENLLPMTPSYKPLSWSEEDIDSYDLLIRKQIPKNVSAQDIVHFGTPFEQNPEETTIAKMAKYAQQLKTKLETKTNPSHVNMNGIFLQQKLKTKIFVDREKNMSQSLLTSLSYIYNVSKKGRMSRFIQGGMAGFECAHIADKDVEDLSQMPQKIDNAAFLKAGRYKIITGPDVTGVIAHEAFGHTQEGDTCRYNRSCAPQLKKKGVKVGNDQASIVNNAAVFRMGKNSYGQNGSHFFDDEGQLARAHVILNKGYLQEPMNDLLSSLKGDINGSAPRQSNGKRESWKRPLMARQTNTYFTAGTHTLEELIAMVDDGYLAEHAHGGMEDPKGMGLTAGTEYLKEIKKGQLTGKIFLGPRGGHIELSDPVPVLLKNILAKSKIDDDDKELPTSESIPYNKWGGCGKYHKELVEASCGGPWILWKGINCG